MDEQVFFVSASSLSLFKSCPRAWHLRHVERLRPLPSLTLGPLGWGLAVHDALEHFHAPDGSRKAALEAFDASVRDSTPSLYVDADGWSDELVLESPYEAARLRGLVSAYMDHEPHRIDVTFDRVVATELVFPREEDLDTFTLGWIDLEDGMAFLCQPSFHSGRLARVVLRGRLDGIVVVDGELAVLEHKTASGRRHVTEEDLTLDEQVTAMCHAASLVCGEHIGRVVYNVLAKPTWKHGPRGRQETAREFEFRVREQVLDDVGRWLWRTASVFRDEDAIQSWQLEVLREVAPAMLAGVRWARRKSTWGGPCRFCDYRPLCETWHDIDRREGTVRSMFWRKEDA